MRRIGSVILQEEYPEVGYIDLESPDDRERTWEVIRERYENMADELVRRVNGEPFGTVLFGSLKNEYHRRLRGRFAPFPIDPSTRPFVKKPWKSIVEKSFRKNVLLAEGWAGGEGPPLDKLITPFNWFDQIHDIARTTVVVRYLANTSEVLEILENVGDATGWQVEPDFEARLTGYHAVHVAVHRPAPVTSPVGQLPIWAEIQVCTESQQALREVSHVLYERDRLQTESAPDNRWHWDHEDDHFVPNYLGHVLHYVDGMIQREVDRAAGQ